MDLSAYDGKRVRVTDRDGYTFTGLVSYGSREFLAHEYGGDEDGIFIEDVLIYASQIASIEETAAHGTAELWTERTVLRRYRPDDADALYRHFGRDPEMARYSGWNPYATPETAKETVQRFIDSYADAHFYGWAIVVDGDLAGTIGAYDYRDGRIEAGFSIRRDCWGRGYATEALKAVLSYLTENEDIPCVYAWCAAGNTGSRRVLEKAGMRLVCTEAGGLTVGERTYDRLDFEYRPG